ncbi:MAG: hypothetical protein R3F60_30865 [bacterium]
MEARVLAKNRSRRRRLGSSLLAGLLTLALAASAWAITVDNVIQMHKSGLPAQVIVQTIQSTGSTFTLSPADMQKLEAAGVSKEVMEVMMASGGAGAAPAPEPAPAPEGTPVDPLEKLRADEESEKARIEEEARIRDAARRAADAERAKMAAEERKRIAEALANANEALDDKDYFTAVKEFDAFIQNSEPNKPSTAEARRGLADALYGLGLYGNAAVIYEDLLKQGVESPVFEPAFKGLRNCARRISYNPVTLEALTAHFVGGFPQETQDSFNYFVGKFFFDYNRYEEARRYLGEVKEAADDYADAQYLMGLASVLEAGDTPAEGEEGADWARGLIGATQNFQTAVTAAGRQNNVRIQHLGYLALARIAYSLGSFDAAIFYYRKVPSDSTNYVNALLESGWSYFLKGDVSRGMGIFHTLDGPDWGNYYIPDTYLLEATVFMNRCHFDWARDAIERLRQRYLVLKQPLNKFMTEYASPEALYKAFVLNQTRKGAELPDLVRVAIISNGEFYDLYTTVTKYRREVARIKRDRERFGADLAGRLLDTVESRQKEGSIALGIKLNQLLQELDEGLTELEVQMTEIRIEIDEAAAEEIEKSIAKDLQGDEANASVDEAAAQEAASVLVGDKYVTWPFEGEYWADEINSYRSDLQEVCKR